MSKYDQLKKKTDEAFAGARREIDNMHRLAEESYRVADLAHNAGEIITDLDRQFAVATKLQGKDIAFLFVATALQCTKWMLMPEFDFNFDKGSGSKSPRFTKKEEPPSTPQEPQEQPTELKKESHYTWQQLLLSPAPYLCDTTTLSESTALGDDPLLGWVFGTLNILSRTVTLRDMKTYNVALDHGEDKLPSFMLGSDALQVLPEPTVSIPDMLIDCYATFQEDHKRLIAAVAKQAARQFANSPEKFGIAVKFFADHKPDEVADDLRNLMKWCKSKKDTFGERRQARKEAKGKEKPQKTHHFGEYTEKITDIYDTAQSFADGATDTIGKAESYLDSIEGTDSAKSLLDKAKSAIAKAKECLSKPSDMFTDFAEASEPLIDTAQKMISSSREHLAEAREYIKQAGGALNILSVVGTPIDDLFSTADGFLGDTAHIAGSVSDLLSDPRQLLTKMETFLEKGWNDFSSNELAKTIAKDIAILGLQVGISILINELIRAIHRLCYDEAIDGDPQMYEVRTRKILSYSNAIASGSNIIYVILSKNVKKLDIGGIAVTIYRIVSDHRFIQDLKREFLSKQWYNIVMGDEEFYRPLEGN